MRIELNLYDDKLKQANRLLIPIIMKKLLSEEIPREGESVDCWGNLGKYSDLEYLGEPEDGGHCFYDNETETEYHSEIDGITHWRYSDD